MRLPIYLDHAATTPLAPEVLRAMEPFFTSVPWNAAASYAGGREARDAIERARLSVAHMIGASPDEIFFTSGGTESDNWALKGMPVPDIQQRPHGLVSAIEHSAVLETADALRRAGWEISHIPVSPQGTVEPDDVEKRITSRTVFVSVMAANNEVGTIQPIAELAAICRSRGVLVHVDAVQAVGSLEIDVRKLGVDLLSLSGHKIYGPKGVGALYIRQGLPFGRWMDGGSQERGMRAGTVNVAGVVGFGAACDLVRKKQLEQNARVARLRDGFCKSLQDRLSDILLTAAEAPRLPHFAHICFRGVEGEAILTGLDAAGVYASAGAACSAGSRETSHVLRAMGITDEWARGAVRFTLGWDTTEEALDYTVAALEEVTQELRRQGR